MIATKCLHVEKWNHYYKKYFIFPEEFYPASILKRQDDDPDKDQDWYKEEGMWAGRIRTPESLERGASFKEFLYNRPEKEIIVVTSNAFINTLVHEPNVDMELSRVQKLCLETNHFWKDETCSSHLS